MLFYSLSNNDIESRYLISKLLLEKKIEVDGVNENGENVLHILLSRIKHNIKQTEELCQRLIELGANINQVDKNGRVPLQYLINMNYTEDELEPLYNIWFSQESLIVNRKNSWGKTPVELAEQVPYRKKILERIKQYE